MNQFSCPNIVCVDKDGNLVPTTTFTSSGGCSLVGSFTAPVTDGTYTISTTGLVTDSAQLEFPFVSQLASK